MFDGVTATIDLEAIAENYRILCAAAPKSEMAGVVKADAYGLGIEPVSRALNITGCNSFYVVQFAEALNLRKVLPHATVAPLYGVPEGSEREAVRSRITPVINSPAQLEHMRRFAQMQDRPVSVILHLDTGMNRLGFSADEFQKLVDDPGLLAGLKVSHVMSHLACSDEPEHPMNGQQRVKFAAAAAAFPEAKKSFANSHGIFLGWPYHFDECRPGRAFSGTNMRNANTPLKLAVRLSAPILQVRCVDSDGTAGYGATEPVKKGMRLATLAGGYADGLMRSLSSSAQRRGHFYLQGHKVPLMGRVSMDLIVVDVSNVPENLAHPGADIEIAGPHQSMDELADQAGTIGYEMLTHIAARVKRNYLPLKSSQEREVYASQG